MLPRSPGFRRRRRISSYAGGQPLKTPLVATININGITSTGANVYGSFNPQGLSGSWWFSYGLTPTLGTTTIPVSISATAIPQAVTVTLSGLTPNATYYVALVGQTAGGTVTSAPLSFIAQVPPVVTNPSSPMIPAGTAAVGTPHYAFPITFTLTNGVGVVEQGSYDDTLSQ
ncbi:MAG: hypothetical protein WB562_10675, partial [Candidatus Sulfotelmatobacter sp.]